MQRKTLWRRPEFPPSLEVDFAGVTLIFDMDGRLCAAGPSDQPQAFCAAVLEQTERNWTLTFEPDSNASPGSVQTPDETYRRAARETLERCRAIVEAHASGSVRNAIVEEMATLWGATSRPPHVNGASGQPASRTTPLPSNTTL